MKGIVITTKNKISVREFPDKEPLHKEVGKVVGGYIEHVHPMFLPYPFCMIVNEDGVRLGLPFSPVGGLLYGTSSHGVPILGNIVLMKDGYRDGEPDIVGLTDEDITLLGAFIAAMTGGKVHFESSAQCQKVEGGAE